ncbi:uncharacterized protein RHO17_012569 isoform 1-T2 [Thomomys bottae]
MYNQCSAVWKVWDHNAMIDMLYSNITGTSTSCNHSLKTLNFSSEKETTPGDREADHPLRQPHISLAPVPAPAHSFHVCRRWQLVMQRNVLPHAVQVYQLSCASVFPLHLGVWPRR